MPEKFSRLAGIFALLAVILGAFAAHGLEGKLNPDQLHSFETGVRYQFYHAIGIFIVAILAFQKPSAWLNRAAWLFIIGILFFSGSIYLLSCRDLLGISSWKWLGPITPIGGLLFIAGWASLIFSTINTKK